MYPVQSYDQVFNIGQKVWLMLGGKKIKATVSDFPMQNFGSLWAVPVKVKGNVYVTVAHVSNLTKRK